MPNPRTPAPVPGAPFDNNRFTMTFPTLWIILSTWGLTGVEIHVLHYLVSNVRLGGNRVDAVGHQAIADATGHDRTSVGRALTHLTSIEAIRQPRSTTRQTFEINPYLAWRGGLQARSRAIEREGWHLPANTRKPKPARRRPPSPERRVSAGLATRADSVRLLGQEEGS